VRIDSALFQVTLVEGRVKVEAPDGAHGPRGQIAELTAGSRLVARDDRRWSISEIEVVRATGWLSGRLTYDTEPVSAIVADMNRYSKKRIVIRDASLAATALSGTYRAGDVDGFVRALEAYGIARVQSQGQTAIELVAAKKNQ
jgi:transmembrane sensor